MLVTVSRPMACSGRTSSNAIEAGRARQQRVGGDADAGRDGAAHEPAAAVDAVEPRGRAEVHHDDRRAVDRDGGHGGHDAIGADERGSSTASGMASRLASTVIGVAPKYFSAMSSSARCVWGTTFEMAMPVMSRVSTPRVRRSVSTKRPYSSAVCSRRVVSDHDTSRRASSQTPTLCGVADVDHEEHRVRSIGRGASESTLRPDQPARSPSCDA